MEQKNKDIIGKIFQLESGFICHYGITPTDLWLGLDDLPSFEQFVYENSFGSERVKDGEFKFREMTVRFTFKHTRVGISNGQI